MVEKIPNQPNSGSCDDLRSGHKPIVSMDLWPDLLTEQELINYLRIPEISNSDNHHNVVEHLKRMHNLPRLHLCGKVLYPLEAVQQWIREHTTIEK